MRNSLVFAPVAAALALSGCGGPALSEADRQACQQVGASANIAALRDLTSTSYPSEVQRISVAATLDLATAMGADVGHPDLARAFDDAVQATTRLGISGAGSLGSARVDTSEALAALDSLQAACEG